MRMASGLKDLDASGLAYRLRTGLPAWSWMAARVEEFERGRGGDDLDRLI